MEQEHIALYRRFRPQTFDEITSQDAAVSALKQAVVSGKIGHAYLFAGQRGTGKTTIAKVFSRAINCLNPKDGNPCNECEICKGISSGALLDVIEIDAASNNGVENVRRICEEAVFAPTKARYKVYIVDEVHMLTTGAYNALLKTLEEPPKHVVFLLATTEPHKILPTIMSRCQKYYFKRIPDDLIVKRLRYICDKEGLKADDDALGQIASLSDGALRDAISLLDQAAGIAAGSDITARSIQDIAGTVDTAFLLEMGDVLIDGRYEALLRLCAKISESGRDYVRFTLDLAEYFRDLLVIRVMEDPRDLVCYSEADLKQLYKTASKANPDTIIGFISYMSKMASDLKISPSVAASFETGLIRICGRKTNLPITPLVIPPFSGKAPAAEEPKEEKKPEEAKPEETKPEPVKEEKPARKEEDNLLGSFVISRTPLPVSEPEKNEEEKKPEPAEEKSDSLMSASDKLSQLKASLSSFKARSEEQAKTEEKTADEPKSEPLAAFAAAEPKAETVIINPASVEDNENAPLDNQIDIFSSFEEKPKAEEPAAKAEPEKAAEPEKKLPGIMGLSDSFIDDIRLDNEEKKEVQPEKAPDFPKGKTSLSAVYDKSGLIVGNSHPGAGVRAPEFNTGSIDNMERWQLLLGDLAGNNPNLHNLLVKAEFRSIGENGYIVFDDSYRNTVENLKGMNEFRKLAQQIKSSFDGVSRLFVCTVNQYKNALAQNEKNMKQKAAEEIMDKAKQMGITTELHFGDD